MAIFKTKEKTEKTKTATVQKSAQKSQKKTVVDASAILLQPHITEKATVLAEMNAYVFKVAPFASKGQIKDAVEQVYGVSVKEVKVLTKRSRKVRKGKYRGIEKGYKKGIAHIAKGQKIELLPH